MGQVTYGTTYLGATPLELAAKIEAEISPQDAHHFAPVGWADYLVETNPFPPLPHWLPIRIGALRWPVWASRWAVGYYLASERQVESIRQQAYANGYQALPLMIDDGVRQISTRMWMLPPRPLAQWPWLTYAGPQWYQSNGCYLLTLVDDRYFWWEVATQVAVTAGATSWASLIGQIATALGITINIDGISSAYLQPPPYFSTYYQHLPPLLDQVCQSVGQRLIRRLDGTVYTQNALTAEGWQDLQAEKWDRFKGGEFRFSLKGPL